MTIDPIQSGPAFGHRKVQQPDSPEPAAESRGAKTRPSDQHDRVEFSSADRELAKLIEGAGPPGLEVSADRLREIAQRLAEGHYNSPEVREDVARAILNELRGG